MPAVVIQLDKAGEVRIKLVDGIVGVVRIKSLDLFLDAEVTEVSSSGGGLVDSAALVGWTNVILLILHTSDITEGAGGAITLWLLVYGLGNITFSVCRMSNDGVSGMIKETLVDGALVVLSVFH